MIRALDSWPVLALISNERCDVDAIEEALASRPLMSWVNAVEVSYRAARQDGPDEGRAILASLQRRTRLVSPDESIMRGVVGLKTVHSIASATASLLPPWRSSGPNR